MHYIEPVTAAVGLRAPFQGKVFLLDSAGAAGTVDIKLMRGGQEVFRALERRRNFKVIVPAGFDSIELLVGVDSVVGFFVSAEDVSISDSAEGLEIVNGLDDPVPVVHMGSVELTAENVGVNNTPDNPVPVVLVDMVPLPATVANVAPHAVGMVVSQFLAASAGRRGFRVKNAGANDVAIGGAGLVFANAVIVLAPGEVYLENEAPGAAWFCITSAGASSLNIQELTA